LTKALFLEDAERHLEDLRRYDVALDLPAPGAA
jgi:hypothetical protein